MDSAPVFGVKKEPALDAESGFFWLQNQVFLVQIQLVFSKVGRARFVSPAYSVWNF